MWLVAKAIGGPVHESLRDAAGYPHTIMFCCKRQMQIDSFMELPKEKRPPEKFWDNPSELDRWFDQVFGTKDTPSHTFVIDEDDVEG